MMPNMHLRIVDEIFKWSKVEFKVGLFGKIKIKGVINPSNSIYWIADIKLVNDDYILGNWKTNDPKSVASGIFVIAINTFGNLMYGYWSGNSDNQNLLFGRWVLCRNENEITKAKELLEATDLTNVLR